MKYYCVSFYRDCWVRRHTTLVIPAKNKTRVKKATREAFPGCIKITIVELETPFE